jgi:hypothetical protein
LQTYAEKAGYSIAGVYREEGISGRASEADRSAFQEMIAEEFSRQGFRTMCGGFFTGADVQMILARNV